MNKIGLFPLNLIIFPESFYPLHIFENRYKRLVKDTLEKKGGFGINYISNTKMFEVGTIVTIHEIVKQYEDGRLDVIIYGRERFVLNNLIEGEKSYFLGDVTTFDDENSDLDISLLVEVLELYNQVVESVFGTRFDKLSLADVFGVKASFLIAQKSGLEFRQKQLLLEMKSENLRLEFLLKHLKHILPSIKNAENIRRVVQNDGYIKPDKLNL